ncbi:MAG: protein kinase [Myxococcota bacterium]
MSTDLAMGASVGRYQLLFRLGKGGMGEVWAARQTAGVSLGFRKVVALKVCRSDLVTENAALMFLDEAKAASVLEHPSIVPTVDLGEDGDLMYIAMDLVQGPSLTALLQRLVIDRGQLPPAIIAYIGMRLASALEYAHARAHYQGKPLKVIHRDVSPHNILIDVHSGEVRLTDFGVARTSIQDHKSKVGTVRGKPSYMAPEQVKGGAIDQRTDVFALGIVMYESACLKRLFGRQNPIQSMDAVLQHTPRPLPEVVPGFPRILWQIIERALHKKKDQRWSSAGEMLKALSSVTAKLDRGSNLSHEMIQLVDFYFERGRFDLDARLSDLKIGSLSEAAPKTGNSLQPKDIEIDPMLAAIAPTVFWPSDSAADPLAPEAIEAARTRYQAAPNDAARLPTETRVSVSTPPPMAVSSGSLSAGSVSAGSLPLTDARLTNRYTTGPALMLAMAALLLASVVGWLTFRQPLQHEPIPPSPPSSTAKSPERQRANSPTIIVKPVKPEPTRNPAPKSPPRPAPVRVRAPPPVERPPIRTPSRAGSSPKVTYEEVHDLLVRVKSLDNVRGTSMIVTLAEAGRSNQQALERLHKQAKAFLRARGRPQ